MANIIPIIGRDSSNAWDFFITINGSIYDITQYINECRSRWIMNGCTDSDWNDYIDKLNAYGLEEYLAIFQKYLDAFYAE